LPYGFLIESLSAVWQSSHKYRVPDESQETEVYIFHSGELAGVILTVMTSPHVKIKLNKGIYY
jgi:hypothetical protein